MGINKLKKFLDHQSQEDSQIDKIQVIEEWLDSVRAFYKQILEWLDPLIQENRIKVAWKEMELHEEYLGTYQIQSLILIFSEKSVVLEPVARLIIGGKGRIDIKGNRKTIRLIRVDKKAKGVVVRIIEGKAIKDQEQTFEDRLLNLAWKIATPPPDLEFINLTQDTFADAILEVINAEDSSFFA